MVSQQIIFDKSRNLSSYIMECGSSEKFELLLEKCQLILRRTFFRNICCNIFMKKLGNIRGRRNIAPAFTTVQCTRIPSRVEESGWRCAPVWTVAWGPTSRPLLKGEGERGMAGAKGQSDLSLQKLAIHWATRVTQQQQKSCGKFVLNCPKFFFLKSPLSMHTSSDSIPTCATVPVLCKLLRQSLYVMQVSRVQNIHQRLPTLHFLCLASQKGNRTRTWSLTRTVCKKQGGLMS